MSRQRRIQRIRAVSRRHSRAAIGVCLHCARSVAPDWPVGLLWPFVRISFTSVVARFSLLRERTPVATRYQR